PEHPPPATYTRSASSGLPSACSNSRTFAAAAGVIVTRSDVSVMSSCIVTVCPFPTSSSRAVTVADDRRHRPVTLMALLVHLQCTTYARLVSLCVSGGGARSKATAAVGG